MSNSVLIAAPTSDLKDYCFDDYAEQLLSFKGEYDVFMVDNSEDPKYIEKIWDKGIPAVHVEPGGSPIEYVTLSQNIIRNKVLEEGYEWLFMLESDTFGIPKDILAYLLMYGNTVHAFTYFITDDASLCLQGGTTRTQYSRGSRLDVQSSLAMFTGEIKPISSYKIGPDFELYASGIGAVMIHRSVFEKVEFRIDPKNPSAFSDTYFYMDLKQQNINAILDTTLLPEHRRSHAWKTDTRLLS